MTEEYPDIRFPRDIYKAALEGRNTERLDRLLVIRVPDKVITEQQKKGIFTKALWDWYQSAFAKLHHFDGYVLLGLQKNEPESVRPLLWACFTLNGNIYTILKRVKADPFLSALIDQEYAAEQFPSLLDYLAEMGDEPVFPKLREVLMCNLLHGESREACEEALRC